jgi:hypothetical protein
MGGYSQESKIARMGALYPNLTQAKVPGERRISPA